MKIFVTGQPGVGKTTLLKRVDAFCRERNISTCGFVTEEVRDGKFRIGFDMILLKTNERVNFASVYNVTLYRFGKYFVDIDCFEKIIEDIFSQKGDIFIIDEIGKMEFLSRKFRDKIFEILNSDQNIIASLHRDFITAFKKYGKTYYLTPETRDLVFKEIKEEIISTFL
uniref:NTPase n=1 Tax=Dictyoglomus thermophilum TaxID=14 RepID=A0A7C3MHP5_DICTH